jgi:predicted DNA-binding protein (UPF0251 family)
MPRPLRIRRIFFQPHIRHFKPAGVPIASLDETILSFGEVEVIRLIDYENTEQSKAAKQMKISQPTLSRILNSARKKLADAVVNGKAIKLQGGKFQMVQPRRGAGMGRGGGRGRMGGFAAGPGGSCVCPKCGHKASHQLGAPCYQQKCPKCGSAMTRE